MDTHLSTPHFTHLFKTLAEENLMAKEPLIWKTKDLSGFNLDKKYISGA
jgi:quinol monooxygenase YgiN